MNRDMMLAVDSLLIFGEKLGALKKDIDFIESKNVMDGVEGYREYDDYICDAQQSMWRVGKAIEGMLWVLRRGDQK